MDGRLTRVSIWQSAYLALFWFTLVLLVVSNKHRRVWQKPSGCGNDNAAVARTKGITMPVARSKSSPRVRAIPFLASRKKATEGQTHPPVAALAGRWIMRAAENLTCQKVRQPAGAPCSTRRSANLRASTANHPLHAYTPCGTITTFRPIPTHPPHPPPAGHHHPARPAEYPATGIRQHRTHPRQAPSMAYWRKWTRYYPDHRKRPPISVKGEVSVKK